MSLQDPQFEQLAQTELTAVEAGYGPLQQEIADALGRFSLAASKIEAAQQTVEISNANLAFVKDVARILPVADQNGRFHLDGKDIQYTARQIQANVLWLKQTRERHDRYGYFPFYVFGRADSRHSSKEERLLLVPAAPNGKLGNKYNEPIEIEVRKGDMATRDVLAAEIESREFSDDEIQARVHYQSGKFMVDGWMADSIKTTENMAGRSRKVVRGYGVRVIQPRNTWNAGPIRMLTAESIESYRSAVYIAKLAVAFRAEEQLRAILHRDDSSTETEAIVTAESADEKLRVQNAELRVALAGMMVASGSITPEEVQRLLEKRYPAIDG